MVPATETSIADDFLLSEKFGLTSTSLAACCAHEPGLDGKPDIVRPLIAADRDVVAAVIIGAIDQNTANAHLAHLGEGDLLGPLHAR
jgi:hypothetical protein